MSKSKFQNSILVTGGAGFMGSNFIRYFLKKHPDTRIINFDKLTYAGNLLNLKDVEKNPRYKFVKGDIADKRAVDAVFAKDKISAVINFAAESHVDRSILGPAAFVKTDVLGVLNLLEAAREHRIEKFVQVSTDEVYGEIEQGAFKETSPFAPRSPYSASKAGGDHLALAYHTTYGVPAVRVHSCNFYGPYQYPEKFIPLFITNFLEKKKVPLYGKGDQTREWIYTEDFCAALDLVFQKGATGEAYNIGTGFRKKNIEVARAIAETLGISRDRIVSVKDRPGHDKRYALDAKKIRALGFKPQVSFKEGLKRTVEWYKENGEWWRKIKNSKGFREYYGKQYKF